MADLNQRMVDIRGRIATERKMVEGYQTLRNATPNIDVKNDCDKKIRESQRMISYFENSLAELDGRAASPAPSTAPGMTPASSMASHHSSISSNHSSPGKQLPTPPGQQGVRPMYPADSNASFSSGSSSTLVNSSMRAPKINYSNLDLIKADTPLNAAKISRMVHQLGFKLTVEKQYKDGFEKMARLYQADGDKKSKQDAESKRIESNQKMLLLNNALRKYKTLDVMGDMDDDDDSLSDRKGMLRKPQTGALFITVLQARDLDRTPMTSKFGRSLKARPESVVVIKIEDTPRARTHPSRNDRWSEDFEIHVEKANEVEVTIYDKTAGEVPLPVGLLWIRLSDVVEELRRKKAGQDLAGPGWVTAARVGMGSGPSGGGGFAGGPDMPPAGMQNMSSTFPGPNDPNMPSIPGNPSTEGISAWFAVEPEGQIELQLNFVKSNVRKRPYDAVGGGLGRQGAVRKRKEEVHEQNGHQFVLKQFYTVVLCAYCRKFLLNAAGMQCEDCKYVCHQGCFNHVVTKCISKSNSETDKDEEKINHRIPHRFEPLSTLSPNWCCHCGMILPLGRKKARKCSECDLTAHTDCVHLVPDFCGISMEVANRMLEQVRTINTTRKQPLSGLTGGRTPMQSSASAANLTEAAGQLRLDARKSQPSSPSHGVPFAQQQQQAPPPLQQAYPNNQNANAPMQYQQQQQQMSPHKSQQQFQQPPYRPPQQSQMDPRTSQMPVSQPYRPQPPPGAAPAGMMPQSASQSFQQLLPQSMPQQGPLPGRPGQGQYGLPQSVRPQDSQFAQQPGNLTQQQQHQQMVQRPSQAMAPQASFQQPQKPRRRIGLDDFNFLAVLGKGNFGKVMLAEEKASNRLYAIKVLKKDFIIEHDEIESTKSEKRVFLAAARERHPFLLGLHSCFQTETRVYFCMEFVPGGDLMLHIQRKQFSPRQAKFYGAEVLLALEYFHANGIIYRDLKLDNIMLTLDGHIKVADYGLCKEDMWYGKTTSTFCGTPEFMAPEILLEQRYTRAVDWWAFGVLIYEMLLGQSPFKGEDEDEIFDAILEDEPLYPIHMPRDSVSILQKLLTRDPLKRLGSGESDSEDIKRHAFFKDINWDDLFHKRIPPPFFPSVTSATDVSNFDSEFTGEKPYLTPVHSQLSAVDQREFEGFSWTAPWAEFS